MALTGFLNSNVCYSTAAAASDAYFSSLPPVSGFDPATLTTTTTSYYPLLGVWHQKQESIDAAGLIVLNFDVIATPPIFQACDPMIGYTDGLQFSGLLIVVVIAASLWGIISRAR